MPKPNETITEQIKKLIDAMNDAGYKEMTSSLTNLNKYLEKLYTPVQKGFLPLFDKKKQVELMRFYVMAAGAIEETSNKENLPKPLRTICQSVKDLLSRDITVIATLKPDATTTFPEIIAQARSIRVFASKEQMSANNVGDLNSSRSPLTINTGDREMKGFFTPERKVEGFSAPKAKELLNRYISEDPNLAKDVAKVLGNLYGFFDSHKGNYLPLTNNVTSFEALMDFDVEYGALEPKSKSILLSLNNKPEWKSFIKDFETSSRYHKLMNADDHSSITGRNVAMSRVSRLFGLDGLLAESCSMEMTDEHGNVKKGIFMEAAEGKDLKYLTSQDVKNLNKNDPFAPSCIKQAAELQILDYICMNTDRHIRNMLYKFSGDGKKIIGIQGIDNDFSFGGFFAPGQKPPLKNEFTLDGLQVISESLNNHLIAMQPNVLEYCLKDVGLSEKEINGAKRRLDMVQEAIREKRIRVVKDNDWKDVDIKTLGKKNEHSIFNALTSDKMKSNLTPTSNKVNSKQWNFVEASVISGMDQHTLNINFEKAAAFSKRIDDSQQEIVGDGSSEFRRLQDSVLAYRNCIKGMKENKDPQPEADMTIDMQTTLNNMKEAADAYLQKKGNTSRNKKTQRRIEIAKEIQNFVKEKKKEYEEFSINRDTDAMIKMNQESRNKVRQQGGVKTM